MTVPKADRRLVVYVSELGESPFQSWFEGLSAAPAARVTLALARLSLGLGDIKPVGDGVSELRIHWQSGLRIYAGFDGLDVVILLNGGTKRRQQTDIGNAKRMWADYRRRKQAGKK